MIESGFSQQRSAMSIKCEVFVYYDASADLLEDAVYFISAAVW